MGVSPNFIGAIAVERRAGGFTFGWWRAERFGEAVEPHGHDDAHFMYVVGGRYTTTAEGEPGRDRPPFVFNPRETFHGDRFEDGPGLFFTLTLPEGCAQDMRSRKAPEAPRRIADPGVYSLTARLMRECARWESDSGLTAESLCLEMAEALGAAERADRTPPAWLDRVVERLSLDLADDLSLDALGRMAGVHPFHLIRTFRRFHRCSPGEFRRARRLEHAARLLSTTRSRLVDIALGCGFADQSHFSRQFRRAYGFAPGEFRRISCF